MKKIKVYRVLSIIATKHEGMKAACSYVFTEDEAVLVAAERYRDMIIDERWHSKIEVVGNEITVPDEYEPKSAKQVMLDLLSDKVRCFEFNLDEYNYGFITDSKIFYKEVWRGGLWPGK